MARSVGIRSDIRLSSFSSYSSYNSLKFNSFIGSNGDCFDRYLLRMMEMGESLHIINIVVQKLQIRNVNTNSVNVIWDNLFKKNGLNQYSSMEDLINHFLN
jgi:NADH-quinone oxidoreductase subunit D